MPAEVHEGEEGLSSEPAAGLSEAARLWDELSPVLTERTLQILDRRKKASRRKSRGWLMVRALIAADIVALSLAFLLTELLLNSPSARASGEISSREEFLIFCLTLPVWFLFAKLYGLYERDRCRAEHSTADDLGSVFQVTTIGSWLLFACLWLIGVATDSIAKIFIFWGVAIVLVPLARATARAFCRRQLGYLQNTVIVGAGQVGQLLAHKFLSHPEYGINLVGFVDDSPRERREDLEQLTVLGSPAQLPALALLFDIERVVIAFSADKHESTLDLIRVLTEHDVQVDIVPRLFETVGVGAELHSVEGLPLVAVRSLRLSLFARVLKRVFDATVSSLGLLVLTPLLAAIAIAIKIDSPGPVLFRQVRMGARNRTFTIYKFRTMNVNAEEEKPNVAHLNQWRSGDARMFKIAEDPRVTRVGRFLRSNFLDELPQLLNVIKGEMSLVGPRPLVLDEDRHVVEWQRRRLDLRPGMTGLWQALGSSNIPFEEMVKLDYLYVTGWSLFNDVKLLLRTVPVVFRHGGC